MENGAPKNIIHLAELLNKNPALVKRHQSKVRVQAELQRMKQAQGIELLMPGDQPTVSMTDDTEEIFLPPVTDMEELARVVSETSAREVISLLEDFENEQSQRQEATEKKIQEEIDTIRASIQEEKSRVFDRISIRRIAMLTVPVAFVVVLMMIAVALFQGNSTVRSGAISGKLGDNSTGIADRPGIPTPLPLAAAPNPLDDPEPPPPPTDPSPEGYYYSVKKGDSLWKISKKVYGAGAKWERIAKANGVDISRPLKLGTKLFIPTNKSN